MANFYSPSSSDASDALAGQSAGSASTLFITWVGLLSTAVFMAVVVLGGSSYLKLGIERQVTVAALRCFIQLSLLGYILVPIFSRNAWWLTCMWLTLMVTASGMEAAGRPAYTYPGMSRHVLAAMSGGALTASLYGLTATLHAGLSAQYAIPITGMLLGNATSGVAVALSTVLAALKDSRGGVRGALQSVLDWAHLMGNRVAHSVHGAPRPRAAAAGIRAGSARLSPLTLAPGPHARCRLAQSGRASGASAAAWRSSSSSSSRPPPARGAKPRRKLRR